MVDLMSRRNRQPIPANTPTYQIRLTRGGLLFCAGTTLIGLAAIDSDMNPLLVVFGLCLGAITLNFFSSWRTLRGLEVQRVAPDVLVAGQSTELRYSVTNHRKWSVARSLRLVDIFPPAFLHGAPETFFPALRPGETITRAVPMAADQRGRLALTTVRLATSFPFGIFTKSVQHPMAHDVIVLPKLARLNGDLALSAKSSDAPGSGINPSRIRGDEEYYGIREYRTGDNPRRIHWRRSAQTGQLMVREMAKARDLQVWCVVDTHVDPRKPHEAAALEKVLSAAATSICALLERGTRVGLICNGEPLLVLPTAAGRHRRTRLLRELAVRSPNTDDVLAPHLARLSWPSRWRGVCILFAASDSPDLREAARILKQAVGPVNVWIPGTPTFDDLFSFDDSAPLRSGRTERPAPAKPPRQQEAAA